MSANIDTQGRITQLDARAQARETVVPEDAEDTSKLVRLLQRLVDDVATLRRRWSPRRIDMARAVVSANEYRFEHRLGTRVRWWVVDWDSVAPAQFYRQASSTSDVLVLYSVESGNVVIRIEEAG